MTFAPSDSLSVLSASLHIMLSRVQHVQLSAAAAAARKAYFCSVQKKCKWQESTLILFTPSKTLTESVQQHMGLEQCKHYANDSYFENGEHSNVQFLYRSEYEFAWRGWTISAHAEPRHRYTLVWWMSHTVLIVSEPSVRERVLLNVISSISVSLVAEWVWWWRFSGLLDSRGGDRGRHFQSRFIPIKLVFLRKD